MMNAATVITEEEAIILPVDNVKIVAKEEAVVGEEEVDSNDATSELPTPIERGTDAMDTDTNHVNEAENVETVVATAGSSEAANIDETAEEKGNDASAVVRSRSSLITQPDPEPELDPEPEPEPAPAPEPEAKAEGDDYVELPNMAARLKPVPQRYGGYLRDDFLCNLLGLSPSKSGPY